MLLRPPEGDDSSTPSLAHVCLFLARMFARSRARCLRAAAVPAAAGMNSIYFSIMADPLGETPPHLQEKWRRTKVTAL